MTVAWLLLTTCLILFWGEGFGHINAFGIGLLVVLVSAWVSIPIQMARYIRERKKQQDA